MGSPAAPAGRSGINISTSQVTGLGAAMYVIGARVGALFFGWLTDRLGRLASARAPENYHHVTYELAQLEGDRTRLTLTHGNSPSQEAADAMVENGRKPTMAAIKEVAERL